MEVIPNVLVEDYNKSLHEIRLKNGSFIKGISASEPDRFRGGQWHGAWLDELAAWDYLQEAWDMIMFAVRSLFSTPGRLQQDIKVLAGEGKLPSWLAEKAQPLDFLLCEGGAQSIIEAAYRYARHEPGTNVVLFGTGNPAHVEPNIAAILKPPLPRSNTLPKDTTKVP